MTRFPSLDNERGLDRAQVQQYFDMLCDLHDESDPAGGGKSEEDKDWKAQRALALAHSMYVELAGWAVNHIVGRALETERGKDSHFNELAGRAANSDDRLRKPEKAREILSSLLLTSALPAIISVPARHGLQALSAGEVQPLFEPAAGFRRSAYTLARLRLEAVEQAHFLAVGSKKFIAEERVARAFGISVEALRAWEKRLLPRALGTKVVEEAIAAAQDAGRYACATRDDPSAADRIHDELGGVPWAHFWLQTGTAISLAERGQHYQAVLNAVAGSEKGTETPFEDIGK